MKLLEVKALCKNFGGLKAIKDLTFHLNGGEILGLIGPNGAGKSTVLNLITNTLKPDSGFILFDGQDIRNVPRHRIVELGIARTFQALTVFNNLSVVDNLLIGHASRKKAFSLRKMIPSFSRVGERKGMVPEGLIELIKLVGIDKEQAHVKLTTLPVIDQRRVAIATSLASQPRALLLDEPLAGVNHYESGKLLDLFRRVRDMGTTILLIDHNLEAVFSVTDRVLVLDFGELIAEGTPEEILGNKLVSDVYLGE